MVSSAPYAQAKRDAAAARTFALVLVGLAGVAFLAGNAAGGPGATGGALFGAHILIVGLAGLAALLEWSQDRRAEAVAVAAVAFASVLTVIDLANGLWYSGPLLGVGVLLAILALARRLTMQDEERHGAPMGSTWS